EQAEGLANDAQAKSGAATVRALAAVDLPEWVEDVWQIRLRDAEARIADRELDRPVRLRDRGQSYFAAWRVLHGVADEVEQDLLELVRIRVGEQMCPRHIQAKPELALRRERLHHRGHVSHHVDDIGLAHRHVLAPGFEPRKHEELI